MEISERKFVCGFEFAIIFMILLNCIVCEMYELIVEILHVELLGCSSDVSILKPISLLLPIYACNANVGANVEFSLLIQKGHYIFLDDVGSWTTHFIYFLP